MTIDTNPLAQLAELDTDHSRLETVLTALKDCCERGCPEQEAAELLAKLTAETLEHFPKEEGFMRAHDYPMLAEHVSEHNHLLRVLEAVRREHASGHITLDRALVAFLRDWLDDHLSSADHEYEEYVRGRAAGA